MIKKIIIVTDIVALGIFSYFFLINIAPSNSYLIEFLILLAFPFLWFVFRKIHFCFFENEAVEKNSIRFFVWLLAMVSIYEMSVRQSFLFLWNWYDTSFMATSTTMILYSFLLSYVYYLLARYKKKFGFSFGVIDVAILLFLLLVWSPWVSADTRESKLRQIQSREIENFEASVTKENTDVTKSDTECDGVSMSWAPFGMKTECLSSGDKYITFWGEQFDL